MDYGPLAELVAVGGEVLVTAAGPEPVPVPWAGLYTKDVTVRGFVHSRAGSKELARAARTVNRLLAEGALVENITKVLPLSQAARAHEEMERSEEHTSELQSRGHLVCRLLLEKKKNTHRRTR